MLFDPPPPSFTVISFFISNTQTLSEDLSYSVLILHTVDYAAITSLKISGVRNPVRMLFY